MMTKYLMTTAKEVKLRMNIIAGRKMEA